MRFTTKDMTKGTVHFSIQALDLMHGQVIRSQSGKPEIVSELVIRPTRISFLLVAENGTTTPVSMDIKDGTIGTWLPASEVTQPGLDSTYARCGTCDSRHCGTYCLQPYVLDRA